MIHSNSYINESKEFFESEEELFHDILSRIYSGDSEREIISKFELGKQNFYEIERSSIEEHFYAIGIRLELNLGEDWDQMVRDMVRWVHKLQDSIINSIKYNRIYKIAPAVFYMYLRSHGIPISSNELIDKLGLDRYTFFRKIKYFYRFLPKYANRDREKLIYSHIEFVSNRFGFTDKFVKIAKKIFSTLYPTIITTEEVISAVVCFLTMLYLDEKKIGYFKICNTLKVAPSTIIYQVKSNLLKDKNLKGGLKSLEDRVLKYLNGKIN